jgi:hypothetical protein
MGRKSFERPFEDRHDVVAFGSLIALVLPPGVGGLWLGAHAAMRLLGVDPTAHPSLWQAVIVLVGVVLGASPGFLLGGILWVSVMSRILPLQTLRKWAVGNTKGRIRAYAERLVQYLVPSSY